MTCSSVAAVPEDHSVPLLMLKVSVYYTCLCTSQKSLNYSLCNVAIRNFFDFLNRLQSPLFLRNLHSPHQAPLLPLDLQIHSLSRRLPPVPADSAWCLRLPLPQTPSHQLQGRASQSKGCWGAFCPSVRTWVEERSLFLPGQREKEGTAERLDLRGRTRWEGKERHRHNVMILEKLTSCVLQRLLRPTLFFMFCFAFRPSRGVLLLSSAPENWQQHKANR